jgi:predicted site-specific integrase-resolvase
MKKVFIDRIELAERWMVSTESIKRYEKQGILQPIKIAPRVIRYRMDDIEAIETGARQDRKEYKSDGSDGSDG